MFKLMTLSGSRIVTSGVHQGPVLGGLIFFAVH